MIINLKMTLMTLSTSFQIVPANSYLPKNDNSSMETCTNVLMIRQSNDKSYNMNFIPSNPRYPSNFSNLTFNLPIDPPKAAITSSITSFFLLSD